jgi:trk system potassium uptake protein TrkA
LARLGEAVLPGPGTVLQEGDVLHVIALETDLERIEAVFASRAPGGRPAGKRGA